MGTKTRGSHRYLGNGAAEALAKYPREIGLLGQGVESPQGDIGFRESFNRYLTGQERALHAGKLGTRSQSDSAATLRRVARIVNDRLVSSLVPADFSRLNQRLAKGRSPITAAGGEHNPS